MERETGVKKAFHWKSISEVVYDAEGGVIWNNRAAASEPVARPRAYFLVFVFIASCVFLFHRVLLLFRR